MREIKFRAWDTVSNEMINFCDEKFNPFDYRIEVGGDEQGMYFLHSVKGKEGRAGSDFILRQYTGLKDKNGVEIYDGDIVESNEVGTRLEKSGQRPLFEIISGSHEYVQKTWCIYTGFCAKSIFTVPDRLDSTNQTFTLDTINEMYSKHYEVIGNIHENPELLEKK